MKLAKSVVARPVKVVINSRNGHQWGQIKDARSGFVLHTGRLPYIKYTAKKKYNHSVTI
jgi:hypothetical protein